ncbi:DoxX family protein [Catellatospora sp. NPDC049111]|uniref:DoxX family protein n=1 Tax=Catellatospora sp. NPDC049111 TaxID=3155271 RepID=UPI0033CD416B
MIDLELGGIYRALARAQAAPAGPPIRSPRSPALSNSLGSESRSAEECGHLCSRLRKTTIGLLTGLLWWPVGVAAAIGVILYFVGAIAAHLRQKDWAVTPAAILAIAAGAALVLRMSAI